MKQTSESSPLLPEAKSKAAPNGVSPLAMSKKPEVIFSSFSFCCSLYSPHRNQTLWSWESKSLELVELLVRVEANLVDLVEVNFVDLVEANLGTVPGSRTPWVTPPGMFFFSLPISFDLSTNREEQTDEKFDSRMKEVESNSSSGPRQHGHSLNLGGCPNGQKTVQKNSSSAVCISSLPPSNLAPGHCQGSNSKDPSTNKAPSLALSSSSSSSCQKQPPECQGGGSEPSKAISSNGVKGKGEGKGAKGGHHHHHHHHHHHQHARRLVINLDDKNKFTEEVTV